MEQDNRNYFKHTNERALNGTYYRRPGQETDSSGLPVNRVPDVPANSFARASMALGVAALVSVFTFTIFPAVILGALSIILALLSRGAELTFHSKAKTGIMLTVLAILANVALLGGTVAMIFGDNPYHDELNATYEEMFGMTYDEILQGIMDGTVDADDLYEQLYEQLEEEMY